MKILYFLSIALLASCSAMARPPFAASSSAGVVRAYSTAEAQRISDILLDLAPEVAQALQLEVEAFSPLEVWMEPSVGEDRFYGTATSARIQIEYEEWLLERHVLAHEIAHCYTFRDVRRRWASFPLMFQEGAAELAALQAVPESAMYRIRDLREALAGAAVHEDLAHLCTYSHGNWEALGRDSDAYYGLCLVLASRIGLEELAAICKKSGESKREWLSPRWLIQRTGLEGTGPQEWVAAMDETFGKPNLVPGHYSHWLIATYDLDRNVVSRRIVEGPTMPIVPQPILKGPGGFATVRPAFPESAGKSGDN